MWNATPHVDHIPLQEQPIHNLRHTNRSHRPHRHTNRQEKCRKRPTDQGSTHYPPTPLGLNYISTDTIIRTKWWNQQNPNTKETHNTTQYNPHPIPPAQTPSPKNQPYPSDQRDTNNTYRTKSILQITDLPTTSDARSYTLARVHTKHTSHPTRLTQYSLNHPTHIVTS